MSLGDNCGVARSSACNLFWTVFLVHSRWSFDTSQSPLDGRCRPPSKFKIIVARAEVLDNVYLRLSQAPNLHHIYPQNFLDKIQLPNKEMIDSLMNICFLRAQTNIKIGDKNPLHYFKEFEKQNPKRFDEILNSHLIPKDFIQKPEFTPKDYVEFLNARAELFAKKIQEALPDVTVKVI